MSSWTNKELPAINTADELRLATMRPDGTLRNPVTIWVVSVGEEVYIRAVKGPSGTWFRHALERHAGHIEIGSVSKDVNLVEADANTTAPVDAAYRAKYSRYGEQIVGSTLTPPAQAATLRSEPAA